MTTATYTAPTVDDIKEARERLGTLVRRTPTWKWDGPTTKALSDSGTEVYLKLELFQYAGSFKARGALLSMMGLIEEDLKKGVTAVSAGNHAIAVSYAAKAMGTSAKVVMPETTPQPRIDTCTELGAEVVLAEDVHVAFDLAYRIEKEEGRTFIHPFEGPLITLGTATCGLELLEDVPDLDAIIIPVGGGGLISGIAAAVKQMNPNIEVYGVEPTGADTMHKSFKAGKPEKIDKVNTIASSLGSPHAAEYSFAITKQYTDELVYVNDQQLASTMDLMFNELKLACEPAAAAASAALLYPLKEKLTGKKVGVIVCGSNIDTETFYRTIQDHA